MRFKAALSNFPGFSNFKSLRKAKDFIKLNYEDQSNYKENLAKLKDSIKLEQKHIELAITQLNDGETKPLSLRKLSTLSEYKSENYKKINDSIPYKNKSAINAFFNPGKIFLDDQDNEFDSENRENEEYTINKILQKRYDSENKLLKEQSQIDENFLKNNPEVKLIDDKKDIRSESIQLLSNENWEQRLGKGAVECIKHWTESFLRETDEYKMGQLNSKVIENAFINALKKYDAYVLKFKNELHMNPKQIKKVMDDDQSFSTIDLEYAENFSSIEKAYLRGKNRVDQWVEKFDNLLKQHNSSNHNIDNEEKNEIQISLFDSEEKENSEDIYINNTEKFNTLDRSVNDVNSSENYQDVTDEEVVIKNNPINNNLTKKRQEFSMDRVNKKSAGISSAPTFIDGTPISGLALDLEERLEELKLRRNKTSSASDEYSSKNSDSESSSDDDEMDYESVKSNKLNTTSLSNQIIHDDEEEEFLNEFDENSDDFTEYPEGHAQALDVNDPNSLINQRANDLRNKGFPVPEGTDLLLHATNIVEAYYESKDSDDSSTSTNYYDTSRSVIDNDSKEINFDDNGSDEFEDMNTLAQAIDKELLKYYGPKGTLNKNKNK